MNVIEYAKKVIPETIDNFAKTLEFIPDDKLTFSPSPTAKCPLQIAGHVVITNFGFSNMLKGEPSKYTSVSELLESLASEENKFTTRESITSGLNASKSALQSTLDELTEDGLNSYVQSARGSVLLRDLLLRIAPHIQMHRAQIDYIQTIWGDRDPHL